MAHHEIKFEGLYEVKKALAKNISLTDVKRVIRVNGAELQARAQRNADFKGHYRGKDFIKPTGNLKGKIKLELEDDGLTASVNPEAEYSAYVEFGTRYMDAQPYLKPAWDEQKEIFKRDMQRLCK